MNNYPWDQTVVGWVHITSAAAVVGFVFVWLFALLPAGADVARTVVGRYRPIFWAAAGLLPLTGAYTWYIRTGQGYPGFYFHVLYTKILLYVVLFGIAGMLTKPRAGGPGNARALLGVCAAVCLVLLFLSAFMRRVKPEAPATAQGGFTAATAIGASGTTTLVAVVMKGGASGWQK